MEKSPDIMGLRGKDDLIRSLSTLVVFPDGHFHSHQEYANHLMSELRKYNDSKKGKPSDKELVDLVHSTMKMHQGYEYAVLRELGMATSNGHFCIQFIRNWMLQAQIFKDKQIPYNFLFQIAHTWMKEMENGKYTVFLPENVPEKEFERPEPPKPQWLKILEQQLPEGDDKDAMSALAKEYGTVATAMRKDFQKRYMDYYMACNEPDLVSYNFPLLADMYRNETPEEFDARIERYVLNYKNCEKETKAYKKSIKEKFDAILIWLECEARKKVGNKWEEDEMENILQRNTGDVSAIVDFF